MRRLLRATLEQVAFTPVLAADGETALVLVREQPPAAVLLDINLPGLDGISVCRTIKEQPETADLPVIMLTGRGDEDAEERARAAGAAAYLLKPCSPRQVQALLRTLLGT
jgi:DNA-binding response OmpR family regulator